MTEFTRLTLVGSVRRAELVVPNDESLADLLPHVMELLDEPAGPVSRPLTFVRVTGEQLDGALTPAEQRLADGEQLRLVRADEAPPPPEVADVTDVVGDTYAARTGRWGRTSREATGAGVLGALSCVTLLAAGLPSSTVGVAALLVLAVVAAVLGRTGHRWLAIALTAAAAGTTPAVAAALTGSDRVSTVAVGAVLVWVALGIGVGVGLARRSALAAAVLGVVLSGLPVLLAAGLTDRVPALAVGGVAAAVVAGLLPWYAMSASGLTGLDDQVVGGRPGRRPSVQRTVDDAYRTLSWSCFAVALPLGGTAALLVREPTGWALALGLVLVALTALRTRAFPLAVQQIPLWLAAAAAAVVVVLAHPAGESPLRSVLVLAALGLAVLLLVGARPAPHIRARLRRLSNLLEALAVISLVPLLLGVFGIYTDLVGAFS